MNETNLTQLRVLAAALAAALSTNTLPTRPPIPPMPAPTPRAAGAAVASVPSTVPLLISWPYPTNKLSADVVFRVYHTSSITAPDWQIFTNVLGGKTNVLVSVVPDAQWYTVTSYSVFWREESSLALSASTPPAPEGNIPLTITRP